MHTVYPRVLVVHYYVHVVNMHAYRILHTRRLLKYLLTVLLVHVLSSSVVRNRRPPPLHTLKNKRRIRIILKYIHHEPDEHVHVTHIRVYIHTCI